jgi:hypothetical protein
MEQWARRRPHDPALWCADEAWSARHYSFAELADRFRRASGFLYEAGIRRGDRVLVMLPAGSSVVDRNAGLDPARRRADPRDDAAYGKRYRLPGPRRPDNRDSGRSGRAAKAVGFGRTVILDDELETGLTKTAADFEPEPSRPDDPGLLYLPAARPDRRRWSFKPRALAQPLSARLPPG